jgi:glycosyltransferase involved in cell wall biosynthesis
MAYNIRIVSTYPPRRCGIGTFSRDLANALEHFTGEVGSIRVAAIDNDNLPYSIPVDLVIEQYNGESWGHAIKDVIARANESHNPTVVLLQHEYGLDPDKTGEAGRGANFVDMAKAFQQQGLTTLVYLHTVLDNPDEHQKKTLQDLAKYSDGLIVTTESAIHILESRTYGIGHAKLRHLDHGIRMQHPSQYDRLAIKERYGLKDRLLVTTLGLLSPGKGVQHSIRAYGKFLQESCTESQRNKIVYLIAGQCHPEFVRADGGEDYRAYQAMLAESLEVSGARWCKVKNLGGADFAQYDVVFLDAFLEESALLKLYGATNVMILPYLSMEQISSGILADTLGSGRVAIATKFRYAVELIHSNRACSAGVVIGRHARGILVDPGEPSVEQIAEALDYLIFNKDKRLRMERQAHQRGYQMRWNNTAWGLLQHIEFLREEKEIVTGRGIRFTREKPSPLQKKHAATD